MDGNRFDALAKTLSGDAGRRGVLAGLLVATLTRLFGGPETDAASKKHRGKRGKGGHGHRNHRPAADRSPRDVSAEKKPKQKKKTICHGGKTIKVAKKAVKGHLAHGDVLGACPPEALCPKEPFQACMEPANAVFIAAIEPCRPQCENDAESAPCQDCVAPAVDAAVQAAEACQDTVCLGGLGLADGGAQAARRRRVAAEAAPGTGACNFDMLNVCMAGALSAFEICLVFDVTRACLLGVALPLVCALAAGKCAATLALGTAVCSAGAGCGLDGWCTASNTCCPDRFDIGCNGACCDADACEECIGGVCVGCPPPQECKGLLNQTCECPPNTEACGGTEDRPAACCEYEDDCVAGECKPPCDQCEPRDEASGICVEANNVYCVIDYRTPTQRDGFCCEKDCLDFRREFGTDEHCGGCNIACGAGSCCVNDLRQRGELVICVAGKPCYGCIQSRDGLLRGDAAHPSCGECTFDDETNRWWPCDHINEHQFDQTHHYACSGKVCPLPNGNTLCCPPQVDGSRMVCTDLDGCCRDWKVAQGPDGTYCLD